MGNISFLIVIAVIVIVFLAYRHSKTKAQSQSKSEATSSSQASAPPAAPAPEKRAKVAPAKPSVDPVIKGESQTQPSPLGAEVPNELEQPIAALEHESDAVARHRLYQTIIDASYKNRKDSGARALCKTYSQRHVEEFDKIAKPLKKANGGKLPHVATFQNYANLLAEEGNFDEAIAVCEQAMTFGLDDKTKSGFAGRKARLEKQKAKA
ncbi:hypothetical protein FM042_07260 [Aliidiomarina halalkaliphila]|uniref:Uncharacterized protein n=1 Tax=Aliidiomarina halalkaliphila TaxID=2593535 RepID=A0A552X171_9GAMM|nr:hypothetical protein [Aliidiomarina halalkaliphila]TRW48774.1 hypothetical protein FM042_07260 [Aliidiomarina halalkaliphila]